MIVKVKIKDGFAIYDGYDVLKWRYFSEPICVRDDVEDLTPSQESATTIAGEPRNEVKIEIWGRKGIQDKQIISYMPVYILNDEGKTIEEL